MSYHPKTVHERILHRLKISLGQLQKVIKMAEKHSYCIDIIHQSHAVQKALKEVDNLILENHLKTCVAKAIKKGKDKQAIAEVVEVLNRS
ncbi:MAG: metal-sensing transcriptional repressor [Candidatus Doudnabacteria bacterium]|nr:metal-sensing transcriptional repressor [Candidatus Doudnabacteria bacterium]